MYNESFCLQLAKNIGLNVVNQKIYNFEDCRPVLCIERYDRKNWKRINQEDYCQALGLKKSEKYQSEGAYSGYQDLIAVADDLDISHNLLDFALFSYLIGNNDGHIKNLSLLYEQNFTVSLVPFYDLVCTEVYEGIDKTIAIPFGDYYYKEDICSDDIFILANQLNIEYKDVESRLDELVNILPKCLCETREKYPDLEIIDKIYKVVNNNIEIAKEKLLN